MRFSVAVALVAAIAVSVVPVLTLMHLLSLYTKNKQTNKQNNAHFLLFSSKKSQGACGDPYTHPIKNVDSFSVTILCIFVILNTVWLLMKMEKWNSL